MKTFAAENFQGNSSKQNFLFSCGTSSAPNVSPWEKDNIIQARKIFSCLGIKRKHHISCGNWEINYSKKYKPPTNTHGEQARALDSTRQTTSWNMYVAGLWRGLSKRAFRLKPQKTRTHIRHEYLVIHPSIDRQDSRGLEPCPMMDAQLNGTIRDRAGRPSSHLQLAR